MVSINSISRNSALNLNNKTPEIVITYFRGFQGFIAYGCHGYIVIVDPNTLQVRVSYELPHDKTNKMTGVPSEDSDQPGHPPSLIRVFAVHMKKLGSIAAHTQVILLVLSCGGSYNTCNWVRLM